MLNKIMEVSAHESERYGNNRRYSAISQRNRIVWNSILRKAALFRLFIPQSENAAELPVKRFYSRCF